MNANLIQQMIALRDLAAPLATGVPTIRSLILRKRVVVDGLMTTTFVEVNPKPHITSVDPKVASAFQSSDITIEIDDFQINGISRNYSYTDLIGTGISYFVDGVLNEDKTAIVSGIECEFVSVTHSKTLCWNMILRRKADER